MLSGVTHRARRSAVLSAADYNSTRMGIGPEPDLDVRSATGGSNVSKRGKEANTLSLEMGAVMTRPNVTPELMAKIRARAAANDKARAAEEERRVAARQALDEMERDGLLDIDSIELPATLPETELDWVEAALNEVSTEAGSLPYHSFRASRSLHDTNNYMRDLSRRNTYLSWKGLSHPGTGLGTSSRSSIGIGNTSIGSKEQLVIKEKNLGAGAGYFPKSATQGRTQHVSMHGDSVLPRWKDLPSEADRSPELVERVLGVRLASLVADDGAPTASTWFWDVPGDDVGFVSLDLTGEAAARFLASGNGRGEATLRRGLKRSLESAVGDAAMVCAWTSHKENPTTVTLFLAIRMIDNRAVVAAQEKDSGTRRVQRWEAAGVEVWQGLPHPRDLPKFFGVTDEQMASIGTAGVPQTKWQDFVEGWEEGDPDEYMPGVGFIPLSELQARKKYIKDRWLSRVHSHGLPSWFTNQFVEACFDYIILDDATARERAKLIALAKKRKLTERGKSRLQQIEMGISVANMRFYKGSPAQFAALVSQSGQSLGGFCDIRHKAGQAKVLYEWLRENRWRPQT